MQDSEELRDKCESIKLGGHISWLLLKKSPETLYRNASGDFRVEIGSITYSEKNRTYIRSYVEANIPADEVPEISGSWCKSASERKGLARNNSNVERYRRHLLEQPSVLVVKQ